MLSSFATNAEYTDDQLDLVFRALADRTRRSQLVRLAQGPATISELAAPFNMSLVAASKHVRVLERAGLIQRDVDGRVHRCSLQQQPLGHAEQWLHHYRSFRESNLDALLRFIERNPQ